jgi:hypothetical protein
MAVNFTGANQLIATTNIPLNGLSACSFMCTVQALSTSNAYIMSQTSGTSVGSGDFGIHISNGKKINVRLNINGTVRALSTSGGISQDSTTLCAVYTGSQLQLWINGALTESANYTGPVRTNSSRIFALGGWNGGTTWPYDGLVEDVRIYNRAFSQKEVEMYNEAAGMDCLYDGLVAWYQLNEAPENGTISPTLNGTVRDYSPNRYNGKTNTASPIWVSSYRTFTKSRLSGT